MKKVAMRLYLSHSSSFDYKNELYRPIKASAFYADHIIFLPHESEVIAGTKDIIAASDAVLAEVSYPSTGQGIELGWANAAGVPIICFCKAGARYSTSLQFVCNEVITYKELDSLLPRLAESIAKL